MTPHLRSIACAAVASAVLTCPSSGNAAPRRDEAWALEQLERWDLTREGRPFLLRARISLVVAEGPPVEGRYTIAWASPQRWREQVDILDYRDVLARTGNRSWFQGPALYPSWHSSLVRSGTDVQVGPEAPDRFQRRRARNEPRSVCLNWTCVDANTGDLVRRSFPVRSPVWVRYEPAQNFSAFRWCSGYRLIEEGREVGAITIESIEPLTELSDDAVEPPADARVQAVCAETETVPKLVSRTPPTYPADLRERRMQGWAIVVATIGEDGAVRDAQGRRATHPRFAEEAVRAIRQWQYAPARCKDGSAIPVQFWMVVEYTLS